jgi:predicted  nucleic acid-binding Zn-ribbon protein
VKADPTDQQRLLELAAEDVALTQLAHRRHTLPEVAAVEAAEEAERVLAIELVRAETEVRDLDRDQKRLEGDVDTVRQREERDQKLLSTGGVAAKDAANIQHELDSLKRRQSDLEDQVLELMERRETADTALASAREGQERARAEREAAVEKRDAALADITDGIVRHEAARSALAAQVPGPLLALYDRIRTQTGTTGAALLKARQCLGCRIELNGRELAAVRGTAPDDVVRCENCARILVRTAESGL